MKDALQQAADLHIREYQWMITLRKLQGIGDRKKRTIFLLSLFALAAIGVIENIIFDTPYVIIVYAIVMFGMMIPSLLHQWLQYHQLGRVRNALINEHNWDWMPRHEIARLLKAYKIEIVRLKLRFSMNRGVWVEKTKVEVD